MKSSNCKFSFSKLYGTKFCPRTNLDKWSQKIRPLINQQFLQKTGIFFHITAEIKVMQEVLLGTIHVQARYAMFNANIVTAAACCGK